MVQEIILAAESGRLFRYNFENDLLSTIFEDDRNEVLMGLEKKGKFLYVGAKSRIFKFKVSDNLKISKIFTNPKEMGYKVGFHQMLIKGRYLYITVTKLNEIWKLDLNLNLHEKIKINPPDKLSPVKYKKNFNHINNIFYHKKNFYVCLNWLTRRQYGPSGVIVLNNRMEEIRRFEYGWESHNYCILDGREYALCGSSQKIKIIRHPHKSGLMVDGKIVFENSPDLYFCKDFSVDENYIYIAGGSIGKRKGRKFADGILFVLDKNFNHIHTREFTGSGGICGCLLPKKDLTKGARL